MDFDFVALVEEIALVALSGPGRSIEVVVVHILVEVRVAATVGCKVPEVLRLDAREILREDLVRSISVVAPRSALAALSFFSFDALSPVPLPKK